jgi:hypothetical protein
MWSAAVVALAIFPEPHEPAGLSSATGMLLVWLALVIGVLFQNMNEHMRLKG